ncbi:MAG: DUF4292 domain-containing protein [Bacteroidales bacterium]|nr:DUF4292 domain-containing protein [Bacteroidales bacterium]
MKWFHVCGLLLLSLWMASCASTRNVRGESTAQTVETVETQSDTIAPSLETPAEPASPIAQATPDTIQETIDTLPPIAQGYRWLTYRGKADVIDPEGTRSCNFYMVNRVDSILYLNIHASGIEFIRVVCTPDSITYVNKLQYNYYKGTYEPFRRLTGLPIDFSLIQSVFNGNITPENEEALRFKGFEAVPGEYVALDSTKSFFTELTLKDLNHLIEIDAVMKLVRLDVPGPTSIRIPEKFEELKMP